MSSESNASKWLVGCLIAGFVGVLLCGGAGVLLVFWGVGAAQQVAQVAQGEIQEQMQEMAFAEQWRPPAEDAAAETLFPEAIGGWALVSHDDASVIPELGFEKDGRHGTYESAGNTVDVYVYRVPASEQTQTFEDAWRAIEQTGYTNRSSQNNDYGSVHWMPFSFSPPERHGRMWWAKDWMVIVITDNSAVNIEGFQREYILAIQGPLGSGIDDPSLPTIIEDGATLEQLPAESLGATPADASQPDAPADASETAPVDSEAEPAPVEPQAD